MPEELQAAIELEALAQRYHTTPTAILREPVSLLRHVRILRLAEA